MGKIQKILIANRGEIALRVMRSAKEMGIKTVSVYSEADTNAPYVKYADESVLLGAALSSESYLNSDKIIATSLDMNVDAIHPGYGFLSENAEFAQKVADNGLIFIGPSPDSIRTMGSKIAAKSAVAAFNIPMVPGTDKAISDIEEAKELAIGIGFPVLIKASAGGGGKGMRVVEDIDSFEEELERATSEAKSAFGDGSVFLEKFISSNKHIEFQILGDQHGNVIHLFDRECTIQRRHQKVIEEAPSPSLTDEIRQKMGEAAINVGKSCGYFGAGTVEFIFDDEKNFYFLEMNTRLQVEHPVTEEITGIDLVKQQIKIAEGEALDFTTDDLSIKGHAIEVRVYAEDPTSNFLPDIGTLDKYKIPMGPGIRVDDGFEEGMQIPIYYDPMISKLIAHGSSRTEAIRRMTRAIEEYDIIGVETTLDFCKYVINHPVFKDASFTTNFVEKYFDPEKFNLPQGDNNDENIVAALVASRLFQNHLHKQIPELVQNGSKWKLRNKI